MERELSQDNKRLRSPRANNDRGAGLLLWCLLCGLKIVGLAGHAGVAEIVSGHLGDRTAGIAERCGARHGLHTRDRVVRSVSKHVLLWRRVVIGLVAFPAWFVCALYLHLVERGGMISARRWWLGGE
uniref:Uncharacterized protein n=1 Tax=Candidatus Methanogaster sp. ANME-2c ERB4 TaxID=2759911 RepID=A0A7G9YE79_9EURY|nr:hypothetical protein PABHDKJJ_00017 [Methanosarcinales archaeon ANME-2c ERB4]